MKLKYLIVLLIVLSFASLFIGVKTISPLDLLHVQNEETQIFLASRVPRLVSIIIAGMSMGIAGLIMQQLSRNKFVSPTTAGTEESAKLGILVSMLIFTSASPLQKMVIAFIFALLGTIIL